MTGDRPLDVHQAKRSLGQNFLVDPNLQRKIVEAIDPSSADEVLEIGPGQGALTRHLARRVRRLVLVELDDDLAARLRTLYAADPSVEVVHADILATEPAAVLQAPGSAKVIGNIPYNITTPILFHLLGSRPRPALIVLMIQREVADRIVAAPGSRTYGALAVGIQSVADVQRVLNVSRNAFRPVPDVESTVLRITPHQPPILSPDEERSLRDLTRIAFGQRRKQFQRILRDAFALTPDDVDARAARTGFDLRARPETFSPTDFIRLANALRASGHRSA
ncbi:MAG TPA: 16S rRNA (adenine(1518)-N(6)/adenine(1519)-N(6))-dimethyltransferase RsmA [Longimicrobiaceae bacterium]|nr:16S rRNA (adenine(1518)-N(6)/adenine(1519)-N(6))-dimethyltransferase RsmA [Longimicrobiaceae bacterium]